MSRVVILAGGSPHAHDFAASGAAVAEVVSQLGHDVEVVEDPDVAASMLHDVDALAVIGLWWRMLGNAYDPWRERHAYTTPASTRDRLTSFVSNGGGLLALHTATISFDDWQEWGDIVGGAWVWGVSSHPPIGDVQVRLVGQHPVVDGLPAEFEILDEVYGDLAIRDNVEVLAVAKRDASDPDQPVVWAHRFGEGHVVFDGFGHDVSSIRHPHNRRLMEQAFTWILESN